MEVKEVIDVLVEQNKYFKDTLFWAVTGILTILFLFVGTNFITQRKIRNRELENIRLEIEDDIRKEFIDKLSKTTEGKINEAINEEIDSYKERIKSLESLINDKDESIASLRESLSNKENLIYTDLYKLEGDYWGIKNVPANSLRYYINSAECKIKSNRSIDIILEKIDESLSKIDQLGVDNRKQLTTFIEMLPPEYSNYGDKIKKVIERK